MSSFKDCSLSFLCLLKCFLPVFTPDSFIHQSQRTSHTPVMRFWTNLSVWWQSVTATQLGAGERISFSWLMEDLAIGWETEQAQITDSFCLRVMLLKPYEIMALGWCNVLLATILAVQSLKQLTAFINNLKVTKIWNKCLKCFLCLLVFSYVLNFSRNKWWSGMWMYPVH